MTTATSAAGAPPRAKALEFQEYALAIVVVAAVRRRRDPEAGHVPDLGQRPQHADPGERRRRARDRHDLRDRDGGHRPLGRLDGRGGRRLRRHPARRRRHEHLVFILGAIGVRDAARHASTRPSIAYGRVVPFIATLAMFSIARGLALLLNDKLPVSLLDLNGGSFGDPAPFSLLWFGTGRIFGIPVSVYVFLAITIARLDRAQPHPLRPLRRRRRRQPRGRADRRRAGAAGSSSASTCSPASSPGSPPCCSARGSAAPRR